MNSENWLLAGVRDSPQREPVGLLDRAGLARLSTVSPEHVEAVSNLPAGLLGVALRKGCNSRLFLHCSSLLLTPASKWGWMCKSWCERAGDINCCNKMGRMKLEGKV